ncbi:hypothetical protein BDN72DRAFT_766098, partial [Pluteus cervinus]
LDMLSTCLCGERVDPLSSGVVQCHRRACETEWYHVSCLDLEVIPRNWACETCQSSRDGKQVRR